MPIGIYKHRFVIQLSPEKLEELRQAYRDGASIRTLEKKYGMSNTAIRRRLMYLYKPKPREKEKTTGKTYLDYLKLDAKRRGVAFKIPKEPRDFKIRDQKRKKNGNFASGWTLDFADV